MAFNGSGTFVRSHNWTTDKTNTVPVTASRMDTECDGFATGLTTAICKDGQQTATARIPFALGVSSMDGTSASASYAHVSDLNTGLYFPAGDEWGLTAGGVGTLTSTATALTMSVALTVNANQVVNGDLGIAGTLLVSGDATVAGSLSTSAGNGIIIPDGSAATPAIRFTGASANSGFYLVAADHMGFSANGTSCFEFNSGGIASGGVVTAATSMTAGTSVAAGTSVTATTSLSGATATGSMIASQAEQETGTATDKLVTPGRQHFHPGAAKAWAKFSGTTGTSSATYNCSTAKDSTGTYTVTIDNDFSSANYAAVAQASPVGALVICSVVNQLAGSFQVTTAISAGTLTDASQVFVVCYGDL